MSNRFLAVLALASLVSFVPAAARAKTDAMTGMKKHHHCRDAKGKFTKCPKSTHMKM